MADRKRPRRPDQGEGPDELSSLPLPSSPGRGMMGGEEEGGGGDVGSALPHELGTAGAAAAGGDDLFQEDEEDFDELAEAGIGRLADLESDPEGEDLFGDDMDR